MDDGSLIEASQSLLPALANVAVAEMSQKDRRLQASLRSPSDSAVAKRRNENPFATS